MQIKPTYKELETKLQEAQTLIYKLMAEQRKTLPVIVDNSLPANSIPKRGVVVTEVQMTELLDFASNRAALEQHYYDAVFEALRNIQRWVVLSKSRLPVHQSTDSEKTKHAAYFDELRRLAGEFADLSRQYHMILIDEQIELHGVIFYPNEAGAELFAEAQSRIQDDLTAISKNHDLIWEAAQHIERFEFVKDFATTIHAMRSRAGRPSEPLQLTLNIGNRVKAIWDRSKRTDTLVKAGHGLISRLKDKNDTSNHDPYMLSRLIEERTKGNKSFRSFLQNAVEAAEKQMHSMKTE